MTENRAPFLPGFLFFALMLIAAHGLIAQEDFLSEEDLFEEDTFEIHSTVADPLEKLNRTFYKFNSSLYRKVVRPIAQSYTDIMPDPIERGLENFFDNLNYPVRLAGNLLQAKVEESALETGKFIVNSTVGVGGFHKASDAFPGFDVPKEDIGQALGKWGIGEGFYIVLPFLGPSNVRDLVGRLGDRWAHPVSTPWTLVDDGTARWAFSGVDFINDSPKLVNRFLSFEQAAVDPYVAMKDGFHQYQLQQIKE